MKYHLVIHRSLDLAAITKDAEAGKNPRHGFAMLAEKLGATVHMPGSHPISLGDRIRAKFACTPELWAMARALNKQVSSGDVIYCTGEDVGFPVAAICGSRPDRPRIAMFAHNLNRPRAKVTLKVLGLGRKIDLFITNIKSQVGFLRTFLKIAESHVHLIQDQTDMKFFTPGPPSPGKTRPIVASVGLEQRDYRTLAKATADLDVDVRISGFSTDTAVTSRAFPETLPTNMSQKFYEWPDLVQLYRDADVIAVTLFECKYSAGITTLMEGLSCRRPMVVNKTEGLADYLDPNSVMITPPGDEVALRAAIVKLLEDPGFAEALANRGHEAALLRHSSDRFIDEIVGLVKAL